MFSGKEKAERSRASAGQWNCTLPTNDQDEPRKGRQEKKNSVTVSSKTQGEAVLAEETTGQQKKKGLLLQSEGREKSCSSNEYGAVRSS